MKSSDGPLVRPAYSANRARIGPPGSRAAFTLIETLMVIALMGIVLLSGFAAITFNSQASSHLGDLTAVSGLVQAKLEAVRAATYKPPNTYFRSTVVWLTNDHSIYLAKNSAKYLLTGKIITKIEPVISGHLVTVTGLFPTPGRPTVVEMQTVVNQYSGGQQ